MRRALLRFVLIASALLAPVLAVRAATLYGQGSGLPNLSVQSIDLDDQGFLWIATDDGALRFDGHRFLRIDLGVDESQQVRRLAAVPGAVYIASHERLQRYDLASHRVEPVRARDGAELRELNALIAAPDGSTWAALENGTLWRWRGRGAPERVEFDTATPPSVIYDLRATDGGLFVATDAGAQRFYTATRKLVPLRFPQPEIHDGAVRATSLIEFPRGVLWIGYWNDALVRLDLAGGTHRWLHPKRPGAGALRSTSVFAFAARDDRLYVATNRGVVVYRTDCDCLRGLNHPSWDQVDGVGIVTDAVVVDRDALWVGVWGRGLARFTASDEAIQHQVKIENRTDGLAHPMVYSLLADPDRTLWIGTYGAGVQFARAPARRDGEVWPLETVPWGERRVESKFVWSLDRDAQGLTIGTGFGLFRYAGGVLHDVGPVESVRSTLVLGDGRRYVGSVYGLWREHDGKLSQVPLEDPATGKLLRAAIWSLQEKVGELWLGTSVGLARMSADEKLVALHAAGPASDQLPGATVWAQKRDASGRLWLGTSGGLVDVDEEAAGGPRFRRHPGLGALGVKGVSSIEIDRAGRLWLGGPNGLVRYVPGAGEIDRYDHDDGLIADQINPNASTSDGRLLYFGGAGGLVAFDPDQVPRHAARLKPRVARLRLGQGEWRLDATELDLAHAHEPIQVELTSLYFDRPERVRYAYRWRETETEFTELGDAQSAVFSRLPLGENTLEIRASLAAPPAQAIATVLRVAVAPAWYQTWWGQGLLLALAGMIAYAWHDARTRRARAYAKRLEGEVDDRTRQLSAASEALVVANARLKDQAALDPLTGIANRRRLFEYAAEPRAPDVRLVVLLCDLDHFKSINDHHGHHAGDAILCDFAALLRESAGMHGLAARYGGEEFVLLLARIDAAAVDALAQRLVREARARVIAGVRYTVSIGVAIAEPGEAFDATLRRADQALYRAKAEGRDRATRIDALKVV